MSDWITEGCVTFQAPGWQPGQTVAQVDAACCPTCGSLKVYDKGNNRGAGAELSIHYWRCASCSGSWKMTQARASRAAVIG